MISRGRAIKKLRTNPEKGGGRQDMGRKKVGKGEREDHSKSSKSLKF